MLPAEWIIGAVTIRLLAGSSYIWAVLRGHAKPNPITWFFWGLTPLIAFAAQLHEQVGAAAWMTLALALGPICIFILSLFKSLSASHFTPSTLACSILAVAGIILWQITDNPMLAIIFSIAADIFGSIPTVIKAYRQPHSEYELAYLLSMASMVLTLCTLDEWVFTAYAFPLYIFGINLVIFCLAWSKIGLRLNGRRRANGPRYAEDFKE